jgi:hypothetical protein
LRRIDRAYLRGELTVHTYAPDDRYRFHHNGGFDGDIIIVDKLDGTEVTVPSEVLLDFVSHCYVRDRLEGLVEQADTNTLLALLTLMLKQDKDKED